MKRNISDFIDRKLYYNDITSEEILDVMNKNTNEIMMMMNDSDSLSNKKELLIQIYWDPTILYKCNNINCTVQEKLIEFVIYRYDLELSEVNRKYADCEIDENSYMVLCEKLEKHFFSDDNYVGRSIKRIMDSKTQKKLGK